jgi:type VI secretion system (T6SS) baseplate-like injector VgrG
MTMEPIYNIIHREVARVMAGYARRTPCIVDAYNPSQHTVKVRRQPEDTLTGWTQIETAQVGMLIAPNIGDPGWLEFHEGDDDAPVFVGSNHNDGFPPPQQIAAGELYCKNKWGASFYVKGDGSITATDKGGASIALDGSGNITLTGKAGQTIVLDAAGNITLTPAGIGMVRVGGTGGLAAARNSDPVTGGHVVASSTKVTVA